MTRRDYELHRIRVRSDGYDAQGAYWSAGPDVFIASIDDGAQEITVRARSVGEAREKIAAERARPLGTPQAAPREPIGGASPNKTKYEVDWRDPVSGNSVRIRITHSRDYLDMGQDHIEVQSLAPAKSPLPITETGYRSHFLSPLELINAGGPVTFVTAWLDTEAKGKAWSKAVNAKLQGDLFAWAEAHTAVVNRKRAAKCRSPKPKAPAATRNRRRGANADNG